MDIGVNLNTKLELKQELKQKLIITPMLRQALKLLQLNQYELEQQINEEMTQNPFLKDQEYTIDEGKGTGHRTKERKADDTQPAKNDSPTEHANRDELSEDAWANILSDLPRYRPSTITKQAVNLEQVNAAKDSLKDHLEWQLRMSVYQQADYDIGRHIIGNLDEDGYIGPEELQLVAQTLHADSESVDAVRKLITTFDPPGIAATSLAECLLIQLECLGIGEPLIVQVIRDHLDDIKSRHYSRIRAALGLSQEDLDLIINTLAKLDPRPGGHFDDREDNNQAIVPDIIISKRDGEWVVDLNEHVRPVIFVDRLYHKLLQTKDKAHKRDRHFLVEKLKRAQWLLKSIHQRRQTMRKVGRALIRFQRAFLDKGAASLKPMILKDIADACDIHTSTVQRIVSQKYVDTPRGVFPLKYFFSRAIETDKGPSVSNKIIKRRLQKIVKGENKKKPYSDKALADFFAEEGIHISRRAITKYRKELGILNSSQRKNK